MTEQEQREGARQFYNKWHNRGREDEDDRSYWLDLLSRVMGLENATDYVEFQKKVIVDGNTKRIDVYIPETKVLIEQKSLGISLDKKGYQSGGISLTPYEQAKRYNDNLPYEEKARWILTSNFKEIWIYDMNASVPEPTKLDIYDLQTMYVKLNFYLNNETKGQAKVHCIIVGYSGKQSNIAEKKLYDEDNKYKACEQISPYLTDTEVCFIEARSNPLCDVPSMRFGSMPRDGGGFVLSPEERKELIEKEPLAEKWIKPYIGAVEFLNNKERYCLWLVGAEPGEISKCAIVKKRVEHVREVRANSKAAGTRKYAATPTLFCQIAQPDSDYIIVPKTSSGKRSYVPLGFMDKDTIASDLVFLIPNAGLYEFGILMSNVHNAWLRLVAGRLKSDFRYSKDIVYNNFVWCNPTSEQKSRIEDTARGILEARKLYLNSTLANMYDDVLMPPELRKAYVQNDIAVMQAYGFPIKETSESDCVAALMKMYQKKVSDLA